MNLNRRTAIIVGVLFIIATVAGVLSVLSYGAVLDAPADLTLVSANENQVLIGSIFYFIMAVAIPAIAIVIYPILKKSSEAVALGYVGARIGEGFFFVVQIITTLTLFSLSREYIGAGEGFFFVVQIITTLTLFSLSREYIGAGGVEASHLQSLGTLLLATGNWAYLSDPKFCVISNKTRSSLVIRMGPYWSWIDLDILFDTIFQQ
jgi:hypothetical protein